MKKKKLHLAKLPLVCKILKLLQPEAEVSKVLLMILYLQLC